MLFPVGFMIQATKLLIENSHTCFFSVDSETSPITKTLQ